jgi:hypothetical protein
MFVLMRKVVGQNAHPFAVILTDAFNAASAASRWRSTHSSQRCQLASTIK